MLINFGSRAMTSLEFRAASFGFGVSPAGFFSPQPTRLSDPASARVKQSCWEMDCTGRGLAAFDFTFNAVFQTGCGVCPQYRLPSAVALTAYEPLDWSAGLRPGEFRSSG